MKGVHNTVLKMCLYIEDFFKQMVKNTNFGTGTQRNLGFQCYYDVAINDTAL